jgi:hypothetical protein
MPDRNPTNTVNTIKILSWQEHSITQNNAEYFLKGGFYTFQVYSTLLHLPPLKFHCVGGCRDQTPD